MRLEALKQLTLARFREFIREPEAVFWTFVFPLLLAGGLAIAFRDKKQEQAIIAMVAPATGDSAAMQIGAALTHAAAGDSAPIRSRHSATSAGSQCRYARSAGTVPSVVLNASGRLRSGQ